MPFTPGDTQYTAVTDTSAKFTNAMHPGKQYTFSCDVDCWVKVTVTGGAAAADTANNILVKAGTVLPLANPDNSATANAFVHVIRQGSTSGDATLTRWDPCA